MNLIIRQQKLEDLGYTQQSYTSFFYKILLITAPTIGIRIDKTQEENLNTRPSFASSTLKFYYCSQHWNWNMRHI